MAVKSLGIEHSCGADEWYVRENGWKQCAPCHRKAMRQWRSENRERHKDMIAQWREDNPEKVEYYSRKSRLKKYGLTIKEFEGLVEEHNGVCAVCSQPPDIHSRLCVDHSHESGEVRGLLCARCNQGLGLLREDTENLRSAIEYLESGDGD